MYEISTSMVGLETTGNYGGLHDHSFHYFKVFSFVNVLQL